MTNALTEKLSKLNTDQVAEIAARLSKDYSNEAGIVLEAAMQVLQSRMPEVDFVRFCEKL